MMTDFGAPATITYVVEISTSSNFGSIAMSSRDEYILFCACLITIQLIMLF